jgi:hypothetical protein
MGFPGNPSRTFGGISPDDAVEQYGRREPPAIFQRRIPSSLLRQATRPLGLTEELAFVSFSRDEGDLRYEMAESDIVVRTFLV